MTPYVQQRVDSDGASGAYLGCISGYNCMHGIFGGLWCACIEATANVQYERYSRTV